MKIRKNFSTAQQRNSATAQQRNRRNSAGYSFAQISFLLSLPDNPQRLPQPVCRCPGFDNDCPEFWWGERPREPHCPEPKTVRPDFVNACPDRDHRRPGRKTGCPGWVSRCPGCFRLCPDFQPPAPFLRAIAPIYGVPRRFCNLLPQSHLCSSRRKEALTEKLPGEVTSADFTGRGKSEIGKAEIKQSLVTSAATTFNLQPFRLRLRLRRDNQAFIASKRSEDGQPSALN
jgi:hypothetical protein